MTLFCLRDERLRDRLGLADRGANIGGGRRGRVLQALDLGLVLRGHGFVHRGLALVEQLLRDRHLVRDEPQHVLGHIGVDVHDRRAGEHVARATGEHAGVARPPADESNGAGAGGAASSHGFLSLQRFFIRHWMWRKLHVKRVRLLPGLGGSRA